MSFLPAQPALKALSGESSSPQPLSPNPLRPGRDPRHGHVGRTCPSHGAGLGADFQGAPANPLPTRCLGGSARVTGAWELHQFPLAAVNMGAPHGNPVPSSSRTALCLPATAGGSGTPGTATRPMAPSTHPGDAGQIVGSGQSVVVPVIPAAAPWLCPRRGRGHTRTGDESGCELGGVFSRGDSGARFGPRHRARARQHPLSSGSAPRREKHLLVPATLCPPAETLSPSSAVLLPSVRPRLSVGPSPHDGAASASLCSAKSAPDHLRGLQAPGSAPTCILWSPLAMLRCRVGFCHLPRGCKWGRCQDTTALDCPR